MKKWICNNCGGSNFEQKVITTEWIKIDATESLEDQSGWVVDNKTFYACELGGETSCQECNKEGSKLSDIATYK